MLNFSGVWGLDSGFAELNRSENLCVESSFYSNSNFIPRSPVRELQVWDSLLFWYTCLCWLFWAGNVDGDTVSFVDRVSLLMEDMDALNEYRTVYWRGVEVDEEYQSAVSLSVKYAASNRRDHNGLQCQSVHPSYTVFTLPTPPFTHPSHKFRRITPTNTPHPQSSASPF